ncbi:MAG: hypothetical protein ACO1N1_14525 [Dyadobacter fermentans]
MSGKKSDLGAQISKQPEELQVKDVDSIDLEGQKKLALLKGIRFASDTRARVGLAAWTAAVVTLWLAAVFYLLTNNHANYCLSDTVLVTLLGTTTLNVLGLSFIVLRGHFSSKEPDVARR